MNGVFAAIISGPAAAIITQLINLWRRKIESSEQLVKEFYSYRIKANENIVSVLYDIEDGLKNTFYQDDGLLKEDRNEIVCSLRKQYWRIKEPLAKNALWADIEFQIDVGEYRQRLLSFSDEISNFRKDAKAKEVMKKKVCDYLCEMNSRFTRIIEKCREKSGVQQLNKKLQKVLRNLDC